MPNKVFTDTKMKNYENSNIKKVGSIRKKKEEE